jgi:imidazolonepropionase-like amidohydrolase
MISSFVTRRVLIVSLLLLAAFLHAQVPTDQLAKPPEQAQQFAIVSVAGQHGTAAIWREADGRWMSRESLLLRGQVWEQDQSVKLGTDGMPSELVIRGVTPQGDAAETFSLSNGVASWKSPVDSGHAPYQSAFYVPQGGPNSGGMQLFIETLLKSPNRMLNLLPGGRAHAERLTELRVGTAANAKAVTAWSVTGLSNSPIPVWTTAEGKFFGVVSGLAVLPVGYEKDLQRLTEAQDEALSAQSPGLLKSLLHRPNGPVAFTHVRAFLEGSHFADDQTVIVDKGVIVQVGSAKSTMVPRDAQVIDGSGKTLVPGLWDSHMHVGDDFSGPFLLSLGITSARDPGNDNALTIARAKRRAAAQLLSPTVYPSVLLDGKGPNTAQVATVATSQDEAIAAVRKAKADGFRGIKFYGTFNPAWVAPAAREAHRLGLHVHGHLPAGMRPSQAIASGYDEITHIYFVMMEAMPDNVVATSNGINRFDGIGRYAKDVNLDAPPMSTLISTMAKNKIAADPTLVVGESLFVPENGDLSPAYAPYVGTLPPTVERGFRQGGFAVPKDLTREDYRKSFQKLADLVSKMHRSGITIVAGTDGSGLELVRELELYVNAGFTPEEALASATIVPARMYGVDKTVGSISIGKVADLVLVEGDPSKQIGELRNTRTVMLQGNLMDADALRESSGFSGRPKMRPRD